MKEGRREGGSREGEAMSGGNTGKKEGWESKRYVRSKQKFEEEEGKEKRPSKKMEGLLLACVRACVMLEHISRKSEIRQ